MPVSHSSLFAFTRIVLRGAIILDVLLVAILTVAAINLLTLPEGETFSPFWIDRTIVTIATRAIFTGLLAASLLWLPILRKLLRIVDSARQGDPFVPENGRRLRGIGWLLLAFDACTGLTVSVASGGFPPVSVTALLTVLMIFVIARIFEKGSEMRTELQETV